VASRKLHVVTGILHLDHAGDDQVAVGELTLSDLTLILRFKHPKGLRLSGWKLELPISPIPEAKKYDRAFEEPGFRITC
jgi:hypothetical protein